MWEPGRSPRGSLVQGQFAQKADSNFSKNGAENEDEMPNIVLVRGLSMCDSCKSFVLV